MFLTTRSCNLVLTIGYERFISGPKSLLRSNLRGQEEKLIRWLIVWLSYDCQIIVIFNSTIMFDVYNSSSP